MGTSLVLAAAKYLRHFQQANYNYLQYSAWFAGTKAEQRFNRILILILLPSPCIICSGLIFLPLDIYKFLQDQPILIWLCYVALLVAVYFFLPRRAVVEDNSKLTVKYILLLVVAFLLEIIPGLIAFGLIQNIYVPVHDPLNSPEGMGILAGPMLMFIFLILALTGPISFALVPYTMLGAYLANESVESVILQWR